jgi:hypothetical protein
VEGKTNGKTIAELMADYLSNNGKEQFDQLLECPTFENKLPHTNSTIVDDVPFSSNDSYKIQTYGNCYEEALCLDNDFGNFGEELEMESLYEYCNVVNGMHESSMDEDEEWYEEQMSNSEMTVRKMYCDVIEYA